MRRLSISILMLMLALPPALRGAESSGTTSGEKAPPPLRVFRSAPLTATFKPLTPVRINKAGLGKIPRLRPIITPKPARAKGPDPKAALDLADVIEDPRLLKDLNQACGWEPHLIFQDQAAGNVFYYLPREFLLRRDRQGYRLSVQYNYQAKPGQPSVTLTAELAAPHRPGDVRLLKAIMRQALGLKSSERLELKSLSAVGAAVDLEALTTGLALPAERIHLTPPAYLKQPFRLTLLLTQEEAEEVLAQIAREGLAGNIRVPVGSASVPVPIRIQYTRFTGSRLAGLDEWLEGRPVNKLANLTDFPLRLESINAYRLTGSRLERVSKLLKKIRPIPPGRERRFKLPSARLLLGDNLLLAWATTSLDSQCRSCLQAVDRAVRQGVALAPASPIRLEAIPAVFSQFGLYKIVVRLRSPYFVAGGSRVEQKEVALTEAVNQNSDLRVYLPADRGPNPLLYRYQLQVVTDSGEIFTEKRWHDARELSQFFGASQVQGLLSSKAKAGQ